MIIVWLLVAIFGNDNFGVIPQGYEYRTLEECQNVAKEVESTAKVEGKEVIVFCAAKEVKQSI